MITTYTDYIDRFLLHEGLKGAKSPGEHHFVAAYLMPKLFSINQLVPDYINPDGTKGIIGDIVYFKEGSHHLGIEVKFGTVRLTKNEFNSWIVNEDASKHPEIFIGIGTAGIIILSWHEFREAYLASVGITMPQPISKGYGPQKTVNALYHAGGGNGYLPKGGSELEAQKYESEFLQLLRDAVNR
ncbi:hypothetical protein KA005_82105 [bacterium]|jgi:hypothetical protein|nr:hypothetical protein [bacterium]